jgi:hypothetical protein
MRSSNGDVQRVLLGFGWNCLIEDQFLRQIQASIGQGKNAEPLEMYKSPRRGVLVTGAGFLEDEL